MPRDLTTAFQNHLDSGYTTLAFCWYIKRVDNSVFAFTSHDAPIVYDGVTYKAAHSGTPSATRMSLEIKADNSDIDIIMNDAGVSEADLRAGLFDYAECKTFIINYEDTSMLIGKLNIGKLGRVEVKDQTARVEFNSIEDLLDAPVGRQVLPTCDAKLGDTRCGVTLATYTTDDVPITSVTSRRVFAASSIAAAGVDYYKYGKVEWSTGLNNGLEADIKDYNTTTGELTLFQPMPYDVAVDDEFAVAAGCNKSRATCRDKFSNVDRFRGFPDLPTREQILSYEFVE